MVKPVRRNLSSTPREMSAEARRMRNSYQNRWRAEHRDTVKRYNNEYWERKAERERGKGCEHTDADTD